jgi:hypothetical protein
VAAAAVKGEGTSITSVAEKRTDDESPLDAEVLKREIGQLYHSDRQMVCANCCY